MCSSKHTPAEVRPASPSWHANHDASRHCSRAAHCSTEPRLLCPVLHLQPTTVCQSATGAADDALPVTSKIYCDTRVCFCTFNPLAAGPDQPGRPALRSICSPFSHSAAVSTSRVSPSAVQSSAVCLAKACRQQLDRVPACGPFASLLISRAEFCHLDLKYTSQVL